VSAKGRRHLGPVKEHKYQNFIQTDAPINPGSSGGPLFDLAGNVVGINTAINAAGQGIGFAIPIGMVKPLIPQLVKNGKVSRSWLGVSIQKVPAPLAKAFGLPKDKKGALVAEVVPGSPAQKAGIELGDIIMEFHGEKITGIDSLSWLASMAGKGKKVKIIVWRKGKPKTLEATMENLPEGGGGSPAAKPGGKKKTKSGKGKADLGINLQSMDAHTAGQLGIAALGGKYPGMIVTSIKASSPLASAGIQRGDVILLVAGKHVFKSAHVTGPLTKAKKGDVVVLYVIGQNQKGFVTYTP
jgi:serine protease Do